MWLTNLVNVQTATRPQLSGTSPISQLPQELTQPGTTYRLVDLAFAASADNEAQFLLLLCLYQRHLR